jgi:hypothetical protein
MDEITFCIPYYGPPPFDFTELLLVCVERIRRFYPQNRILICKTSDTKTPNISGIEIYDTFIDGSHVIGAMELLIKKIKTKNFLIIHDNMFFLKSLPENITSVDLYRMWHFEEGGKRGVFGPAFGGKTEYLHKLWEMIDVDLVLGRDGLQFYERYFGELFEKLNSTLCLNGDIGHNPNAFQISPYKPDLDNTPYDSYMYKVWFNR